MKLMLTLILTLKPTWINPKCIKFYGRIFPVAVGLNVGYKMDGMGCAYPV